MRVSAVASPIAGDRRGDEHTRAGYGNHPYTGTGHDLPQFSELYPRPAAEFVIASVVYGRNTVAGFARVRTLEKGICGEVLLLRYFTGCIAQCLDRFPSNS